MQQHSNYWLHRFACFLVGATFVLIIAGASVTSNRAGLAVPDWPTTYGQFMFSFPRAKWVGNIFYEHGHRLIASVVGMLTVVLALWLARREPRRWMRRLGISALAVVIAQGILGGLTVKWMLPPPISIAHASLAEAFFCMTVALAFFTSPKVMQGPPAAELANAKWVRRTAFALTGAAYLQVILGAAIRHSEFGLFAHILGAALVFGCAVASLTLILFTIRQHGFLRHAVLLLCLVTVQIALGFATLMVRLPKNSDVQLAPIQILVPTIHLGVGALILGVSLVMTLKAHRFLAVPKEEPTMPLAAQAVS